MSLALPELIILFLLILTVIALVDLLRRPASAWKQAGQDKLVWALVVIFVGVIGPILYLAIARPKLDNASANGEPPQTTR